MQVANLVAYFASLQWWRDKWNALVRIVAGFLDGRFHDELALGFFGRVAFKAAGFSSTSLAASK